MEFSNYYANTNTNLQTDRIELLFHQNCIRNVHSIGHYTAKVWLLSRPQSRVQYYNQQSVANYQEIGSNCVTCNKYARIQSGAAANRITGQSTFLKRVLITLQIIPVWSKYPTGKNRASHPNNFQIIYWARFCAHIPHIVLMFYIIEVGIITGH